MNSLLVYSEDAVCKRHVNKTQKVMSGTNLGSYESDAALVLSNTTSKIVIQSQIFGLSY